jgi:hypothetical protein
MIRPLFALGLVALMAGCASQAEDATATAGADVSTGGSFDMTEEPGGHLDSFGCRHYMKLRFTTTSATLFPALDSADPSDMDEDGSCGGEELPPGADSQYPLRFKSKTDCGASVYTGTINWTESGAVKRTLTLTDFRGSTCHAPSQISAAIVSTYHGETNPIATYYSVAER